MPRQGHKSITIRDNIYNELWTLWKNNEKSYNAKGITSFSGFVTRFLYDALERERQQAHPQ